MKAKNIAAMLKEVSVLFQQASEYLLRGQMEAYKYFHDTGMAKLDTYEDLANSYLNSQ